MSVMSTRATDLDVASVAEISQTLRHLLADVFALFMKTKSFHWHTSSRHFREDHLLLDDNRQLTTFLRLAHEVCDHHRDVATASLIVELDRRERATRLVPERNDARAV